ncbi:unnamed protein product [Mycena citricolor]|uniref:NAD(P)-binding protein n=1 Tax=Mycena citricolor TaxID=2018698 RepID=A0AAD2HEV7_9AGAR|nr:unnamed protein product [Mycena citricolor]
MALRPGVESALAGAPALPTALSLFSLSNRVALITGAHRGIGLEMALALAEAGAAVYCLDIPAAPDADWRTVQESAAAMPGVGRLEYVSGDVTDQKGMWALVEEIVRKEGRIDICVAGAGILHGAECLEYEADDFRRVLDVNVSGVLFAAQAVGRQMEKLGTQGSIILIASMSGTITNRDHHWVAYNTSKSAVLQMGRSMACELAPKGIRVNTISPGHIITKLRSAHLRPVGPILIAAAQDDTRVPR